MPKQPLHPNRADAVAPPGERARLSRVISSSSTAPPVLLFKRRRSPSLSASPSPPRAQHSPPPRQPSPFSSFINPAQAAALLGWEPEVMLHFPSAPTPPPELPMPPPVVAARPPSPAPIPVFIAPPIPPSAAPLNDRIPQPRPASPREWTLAEVIERCTTYEQYRQHRPIGYARLTESWAVMDDALRKQLYKLRKQHFQQPLSAAYTHVRHYIQEHL